MTPDLPPPRRRGISLEYRLPLLITTLLVVTMAAGVFFAYAEVRESATSTAIERLELVSQRLADVLTPTPTRRIAEMRQLARNPAVVAFLAAPAEASRPAAADALRRHRGAESSPTPLVLWSPGREPLLRLGELPPDFAASALEVASDSASVSPFVRIGRSVYYWTTVPVRRGSTTLGYASELRSVGGAGTAAQVETLIGRDLSVFFANTSGGPWVALDGRVVPAPSHWPFSGASRYVDASGAEHFAHAAAVPGSPWSVVTDVPVRMVLGRPSTFLRRSLLAGLLLSLAGAAGAWLLSRTITGPVRALRLASESIAEGDYARRIRLRRSDELGILAHTFNGMAARVQATHDELTRQYENARALAVELEEASHTKSEFLATMSHEIRTPINAIIGYTDLLQLGLPGPVTEAQRTQLERIRVSGQHLIGLVDQVLDFSRMESGTLRTARRTASASEAVETAITVVRPQAVSRGLRLVAAGERDLERLYVGDPQRVNQILVNLLSNAIKFTDPGGRISVRCAAREGALPADGVRGRWTCVMVEDDGVGIPPEKQASVFEPFVQVDTGYTRRHGGAGLGLAISLRLARSMGGDLTLESRPGAGSTFTLWLPAPVPAPTQARLDEDAAESLSASP